MKTKCLSQFWFAFTAIYLPVGVMPESAFAADDDIDVSPSQTSPVRMPKNLGISHALQNC